MKKWFVLFTLVIVFSIVGIICYQYFSITKIGESSIAKEADVIIILGAGVWESGPSPALKARVQLGARLYNDRYAQKIIVSGGLGRYPPSEAEAMEEMLIDLGISKESIYLENEAVNTKENIEFSTAIMDKYGWDTAIIVTDMFHIKRALLHASDNGIKATGAPAKESVLYRNKALKLKYTLREVLAVFQYHTQKFIAIASSN
jgi:uncharacterized SAM-binding protein YcdF (DUF218 family)